MTNRSYSYTRLANSDEILSGRDQRVTENDDTISGTKMRRFQVSQRKERWPGSASHLPSFNSTDYIEHIIRPKETLQGIALAYRCTVFELKVANSIQRETEFFARRTLRIPVKQHSSLTEQAALVQQEAVTDVIDLKTVVSNNEVDSTLANSSEFLKQKDQDLQRLKEKARIYEIESNESLLNVESTLEPLSLSGPRRASRVPLADCRGDDCGLSWSHILGMALLVLLACPLLYFLYLELNLHKHLSLPSNVTASVSSLTATATNAL